MKNIRKIVAILSAVLMLCSVLPMSAFAAEGDVVTSIDWNDGEVKFNVGEVVAEGPDGSNCYKWTATGGWSATYITVANMDSAKDYTITMKAKGSVAGGMGITIQNGDWGSYWNGPTFDVTTEWQEVIIALPANGIPFAAGTILFKFQDVGVAMDLYVDDLVISEGLPEVPLCENGDFETGDGTNWILSQGSAVDATAAQNGSYGAHLISGANWNSMLERTFDVVAGKKYELTFWAKAVSGGSNIKFLDQNWQGSALATGVWFNKADWTQVAVTFTAVSDKFYFQFCGAGDIASELYVDDVNLMEISYDGYITNGNFDLGDVRSWTNLWGNSSIELVEGYDSEYAIKGTANSAYNITYQEVVVEPNTDYTVICYSKDSSDSALWIKNAGGNGDIVSNNFNSGSDWGLTVSSFNSGSNSSIWVGLMGIAAGGTYTVDNVTMFEAVPVSNDGYLNNGNFESGELTSWQKIWDTQVAAEIIYGGHDSAFAAKVIGKSAWGQLRQKITVEPNTDYKYTVWAKDVNNMAMLVKDGGDSVNIVNQGINAGGEWVEVTAEFNSGENTSVYVSVMVNEATSYGTFDDFKIEKIEPECQHEYFYPCDPVCMLCYEITNPDAAHNVLHVEAKDATCTENGNVEYWYCEYCGSAWLDADCTIVTNQRNVIVPAAHIYTDNCDAECDVCGEWRFDAPHNLTSYVEAVVPANCQEEGHPGYWVCEDCGGFFENKDDTSNQLNPAWMYYTGDHVRPEGVAGCAVVACELCGEDSYGTDPCVRPEGSFVCQNDTCVNCGGVIYGEGHSYGYDEETGESLIPLCQSGTCIHCGEELEYIYEHENGSYAPCSVDGECVYGCGLQYPATGEHAVDNPCEGGLCWMCWEEIPAADHVYDDDYDVDCNVCGAVREVEAEIIYGDADGNGEIEVLDAALVQQYLAGYDVTLNEAAADADGNGEIEVLDAALIQQYLAGYDVTLGG